MCYIFFLFLIGTHTHTHTPLGGKKKKSPSKDTGCGTFNLSKRSTLSLATLRIQEPYRSLTMSMDLKCHDYTWTFSLLENWDIHAINNSNNSKFSDGRKEVQITHFLFVDDTLVIFKDSREQLDTLSMLLQWFEAALRLNINL